MKRIIDIPEDKLKILRNEYYGDNEVDHCLVNEILIQVLNGTPLNEHKTDYRNCGTCKHSNNGYFAGTEECHECMWNNKYEVEAEDCISRKAVDRLACMYLKEATYNHIAFYEDFLDLPSVTPKSDKPCGKWIDIGRQWPPLGKQILVCDWDGDIYMTHRLENNRYFDETGNKIKGIIAWMPLPEPYKMVEEQGEKTDEYT